MDIEQWWPKLAKPTRDWLIDNNGAALPPAIVAEVATASGSAASAAWWVGEDGPEGFFLSDAAIDWIESTANGE